MYNYLEIISKKNLKYIFAAIFGFIITYFFNFNSKTKQEVVLIFNKTCYHIHHWIFLTILILMMILYRFLPNYNDLLLISFLVGIILEDGLYGDIFKIKNNC